MRRHVLSTLATLALCAAAIGQPANAATIRELLGQDDVERILFHFEARDGVCGNGSNMSIRYQGDSEDWGWDCDPGPVYVMLRVEDGEVDRLKWRVGGRPRLARNGVDVGEIPSVEAADLLMNIAEEGHGDAAEDGLGAAVLARDAVIWPRLLELARDRRRDEDVREDAIFWLGQAAGDRLAEELGDFIEDDDEELELREHAIFALSQRDDSFERLMRIARTNEIAQLRRTALFWLAQHDDPQVLELFEEILAGG